MALETQRLHPLFGVEIMAVDVTRSLDGSVAAGIRDAFEEHSLLLFRGQNVTDQSQAAFSKYFGPLLTSGSSNVTGGTIFSRQSNVDPKTGEFIPLDDRRTRHQLANQLWHSDSSFRVVPSLCSVLSAREVVRSGGTTEFATMRAAWDALPHERQRMLERLVAVHSLANSRRHLDDKELIEAQEKEYPPVRQALVRTNPVNGRAALYMGAHASHIVGWPVEDGRALLHELLEFATEPKFVYSHQWREGDVVVYDNRCLLHRATPFDSTRFRRFLQRTTIAGDGPTAPQKTALESASSA
ncbi:MAG: TauD/TfdA family dioxygenase [Rhodospirillales bacterium]